MTTRYFYARPLVLCALGICTGVTIGRYLLGPYAWAIVVFFLLFSAVLLKFKKYKAFAYLLFIAIGLARILIAYPQLPPQNDNCLLRGTICDTPVENGHIKTTTLKNAYADGVPIDGKVALRLYDVPNSFEYGMEIEILASLSLPQGARNEGGMDMRFYYLSQGAVCTAANTHPEAYVLHRSMDFYGWLLNLKESTTRRLITLIGEPYGAVAAGMLHGETKEIPSDTLSNFRESGIAHLLAVSGLHVTLLCGALLLLLKRLHPYLKLLLIGLFLLFYCMFTAFSPSTLRASIMMLCLLLGNALERRSDPLCALSFSCLLILLIAPFELFTVGFQLSFCAVLGLLLLATPLTRYLNRRLPLSIASPLAVSVSAQLGTWGATAAYFNRLPVFSIFANMLVVPLAPLVMLPSLLALFAFPFSHGLARTFASIAGVTLRLMDTVASFAANLGAVSFSSPSLAVCLLSFILLLFLSDYFLGPKKHMAALAVLCAALCVFLYAAPRFIGPTQSITVLDVSSGYAVHIQNGQSHQMIGTQKGVYSSAAKAYLEYHHISPQIQIVEESQMHLSLDGHEIIVGTGYAIAGGAIYPTAINGQMRISIRNAKTLINAYSSDAKYAILKE
ncbi:ComEC family competence protein [Christensenellaceae bacterium OttesenSCG-928-M15]|nr:ComEC family competence protein [Christensenellaceae bacterium OttesenSCG-928-M15]